MRDDRASGPRATRTATSETISARRRVRTPASQGKPASARWWLCLRRGQRRARGMARTATYAGSVRLPVTDRYEKCPRPSLYRQPSLDPVARTRTIRPWAHSPAGSLEGASHTCAARQVSVFRSTSSSRCSPRRERPERSSYNVTSRFLVFPAATLSGRA